MTAAASYDDLIRSARDLAPVLRERAAAAEALRRLPDETIADLRDAGLFKAFRPARYGGIEAPFRGFIELGAWLARGCGSTSWVYNNLVSHNWMLGYWPSQAQDEVWGAEHEALIGSGLVMSAGAVRPVEGGWRLSGRWPFSSGVDPVAWLMLGSRFAGAAGTAAEPHLFLVPRADYRVVDTWHVMGLAATGSKDVVVDDAFVPSHRAVPTAVGHGGPHPGSAVNSGPLYRLPWLALFSFVTAGTSLGIAQGAVRRLRSGDARAGSPPIPARRWPSSRRCRCGSPRRRTLVDAAETVMLKDCDEAMAIAADRSRARDCSTARGGGATALMRRSLRRARSISSSPAPAAAPFTKPIRCSGRCATCTRPTAISA